MMTNKQYWRRRRALDRLGKNAPGSLVWRVEEYERGGDRAINGKTHRHRSSAASRATT